MNWINFIRTCLIASLFLSVNLYSALATSAEEFVDLKERYEVTQALNQMFEALRSGDVETLKRLLAEDMYAKNKILLEKNAGYPQFLRNFYRGTLFEIKKISPDDKDYIASFTTLFPNGSKSTTHLIFAQRALDSQQKYLEPGLLEVPPKGWVIVKQIVE